MKRGIFQFWDQKYNFTAWKGQRILCQEHRDILGISSAKVKREEFSHFLTKKIFLLKYYYYYVLTPLELFKICESFLWLYPNVQTTTKAHYLLVY